MQLRNCVTASLTGVKTSYLIQVSGSNYEANILVTSHSDTATQRHKQNAFGSK